MADEKMAIGYIIDLYTMCKLKIEREHISKYQGIEPYVEKLYYINGKIWDLETDIHKGKEGVLEFSEQEMGQLLLILRCLYKEKVAIRNEINSIYKDK